VRVGILGGGVIARLFLEQVGAGRLPEATVVAVAGRGESSRGKALAREFDVPFVVGVQKLIAARPEIVIERPRTKPCAARRDLAVLRHRVMFCREARLRLAARASTRFEGTGRPPLPSENRRARRSQPCAAGGTK
jgi:hypothetical protein